MDTPRPPAERRLIVNADDFGLSAGVNAGIARAHRQGILTSTTILANAPAFDEAVALADAHPELGVGLHLNLVRGPPLSNPRKVPLLLGAEGRLRPFRLGWFSRDFLVQAEGEYRRQFEKALDAGLRLTHVDFEKHHAWRRPLYRLACRLARSYGVTAIRNLSEPVAWALRAMGWPGRLRAAMAAALRCGVELLGEGDCILNRPDRLLGQTHIGAMDETAWLGLIRHLPPGTSEVMTHPGGDDGAAGAMGGSWLAGARETELAALLSERVREAVAAGGIRLASYRVFSRDGERPPA